MNTRYILPVIICLFCACIQKRSTGDNSTIVTPIDTAQPKPLPGDTLPAGNHDTAMQIGNAINLFFKEAGGEYTVAAHIDSIYGTVVCAITTPGYQKLTASVNAATGTGANLRFNQVFQPNGESDGPFGKDLTYPLDSAGTYKLIIGASKMADSPYTGKFILKVKAE